MLATVQEAPKNFLLPSVDNVVTREDKAHCTKDNTMCIAGKKKGLNSSLFDLLERLFLCFLHCKYYLEKMTNIEKECIYICLESSLKLYKNIHQIYKKCLKNIKQ